MDAIFFLVKNKNRDGWLRL